MSSLSSRCVPFISTDLYGLFSRLRGYLDMGNDDLGARLLHWELLNEENRNNPKIALYYLKWSFSVSFIELLNSLQWFLSGLILQRNSYLPAQVLQQYYYSIFFSSGSFLALHGKGIYTVHIEELPVKSPLLEPRQVRKELWFEQVKPPRIAINDRGRGGEHEIRANWYYEVINNWDKKKAYPGVLLFHDDRTYHSSFRNMFTYSLSDMAEELHHLSDWEPITNDVLLRLWNHDIALIDYFPEEYWVIENLRVALEMHKELIENYSSSHPFGLVQRYLLESIVSRHERDGTIELVRAILQPLLNRL